MSMNYTEKNYARINETMIRKQNNDTKQNHNPTTQTFMKDANVQDGFERQPHC